MTWLTWFKTWEWMYLAETPFWGSGSPARKSLAQSWGTPKNFASKVMDPFAQTRELQKFCFFWKHFQINTWRSLATSERCNHSTAKILGYLDSPLAHFFIIFFSSTSWPVQHGLDQLNFHCTSNNRNFLKKNSWAFICSRGSWVRTTVVYRPFICLNLVRPENFLSISNRKSQ